MGRVKRSGYDTSMYPGLCYSYVTRMYPCGVLVKILSKTVPILSVSAGPLPGLQRSFSKYLI